MSTLVTTKIGFLSTPWLGVTCLLAMTLAVDSQVGLAQTTQLPSGSASPIQGGISSGVRAPVEIPQTNLTPVAPPSGFGAATGAFADPYAASPAPTGAPAPLGILGQPTVATPPPGASLFSRLFSRPAPSTMIPNSIGNNFGATVAGPTNPPGFGGPSFGAPAFGGAVAGAPPQPGWDAGGLGLDAVYGTPSAVPNGFGQPAYPSTIYPSQSPNSLFPQGLFTGGLFTGMNNWNTGPGGINANTNRFLVGPRIRHTYVGAGDEPTDVETNDTDVSLVFAVPRFLYSNQSLFIIPSFSLHLWDGPDLPGGGDLPPSAYSAFIDVGWEADPARMFATEFGMRIGAFTDFDTFNSRSVRYQGKGLLHFRLTPVSTFRAGVYYLDRNDIKLIPAGGVLWQPDPFTRFDIFFPKPKLSRYFRTLGTRDVWWYLAADYGGGSWTIRRANGTKDSIDINEIRVLLGLEWGLNQEIQVGQRRGFAEVGFVFDREVEYRFNPTHNFNTDDAFLVRLGIGY